MFKIQKTLESHKPKKQTQQQQSHQLLPKLIIQIKQQTLLHYKHQDLIDIVNAYFDEQQSSPNITLTIKAMTVISKSLKDNKIIVRLNQIFKQFIQNSKSIKKGQQFFILYACCFRRGVSIQKIINKLDDKIKLFVIGNFLCEYFYGLKSQNYINLYQCLESLFLISYPTENNIQKIHHQYSNYLMNSLLQSSLDIRSIIQRFVNIETKNEYFIQFLRKNLQYALSKKQKQFSALIQLYIEQDKPSTSIIKLIDKMFIIYPSVNILIQKSIKSSINSKNLIAFNHCIKNKQLENIFKGARRQWINNQNNCWNFVDQNFNNPNIQIRNQLITLGIKEIDSQQNFNEIISIKYLYDFFKYDDKKFQKEGQIQFLNKLSTKNDCLIEMSKAAFNSKNLKSIKDSNIKLIQINNIYYPKNWKVLTLDTLQNKLKIPSFIKSQIEKIVKIYKEVSKQALQHGKKLQLAQLVINFEMKSQPQKIFKLTIQQLILFLNNQNEKVPKIINEILPPSFKVISQTLEKKSLSNKKDQIVIQALIVKQMKRNHKKSFSIENLSEILNTQKQICGKAIMGLIRKSIVQKCQQQGKIDEYIYLP